MLTAWNNWPNLLAASSRQQEEFVTELRYIPEGWWGVAVVATVLVVCWAVISMYRREGRRGASLRLRTVLGVVRSLVLVLLVIILLEPVRVRILRKWIDSYTLVLVDQSSSMGLADMYRDSDERARAATVLGGDPSQARREELVQRTLSADDRAFLSDLAKRNRVQVYGFSNEPKLLGTIRAGWEDGGAATPEDESQVDAESVKDLPLTLKASGSTTNVERAVRRSVEALGNQRIAGVVVFSDGEINQGATAEDIARFAVDHDIPIYAVGVGDPSPARNVRIAEVLAPENAFKNDPFTITVRLATQGVAGETLRVELYERDEAKGGEGRIVATKSVRVGSDGAVDSVSFERSQAQVGRYAYTVRVPVLESETVAEDNESQTLVNVIDARTRVLLVAGEPSWDYRYLTRLLQRDATFDLSVWLQSADLAAVREGNTVIDHLPADPEELLAYDAIILMDPDPSELSDAWCQLVDTFVTQHAGGLLYTAARPRTAAFMRDPAVKSLIDLLPVTLDPEADLVLNRIGHYQTKPSPLEIPSEAFGHPIMRLGSDVAATKLGWQGIGDIYWHYPVRRAKPAATVLMRDGDPAMRNDDGGHVLAAVQYAGAGCTGFLAIDGTWRWRRFGPETFDRFWVQFVRYLVESKLLGGSKRGTLMTQSDQYSLGEAVTVTARLFDARFEPLKSDQVKAKYELGGGRREFSLLPDRDRPGWFEGRFVPDQTGVYRISVELPTAPGRAPDEIARDIRVSRPNIEIMRPQMDRANLTTLAEHSAGGRYFEIDQASQIPNLIPDLHEEIPIRSRPTSLWDNWAVLSLLIGLLCMEWAIRKWKQLL